MSGPLLLLNILLLPLLCRSSEDVSDVTWGHAINSRKDLEDALQSNINFLEADVSLGSTNNSNGIPIMSHPPSTSSDISLEEWMATVIKANTKKGIKLDFKSTEVLEPSLKILDKIRSQLTFELWLNADILTGPFNSSATHVDAKIFLQLCKQYFPKVTLSVGWSTQLGRNVTRYSWNDVSEMARVLRCQNIAQPITFPIRGVFVKDSVPQFLWLSSAIPKSTFTVWSSVWDPLDVSDLLELRKALPVSQVYYDLPSDQNKDFLVIKNTVTSPKDGVQTNLQLKTLPDPLFTCNTETIVGGNSIVYGGEGPVAVVYPGVVKRNVNISGRFYPCDTVGTCASVFDSKFAIKISNSPDFWNSNAWASLGEEVLTIEASNPIEGSLCNISFHLTIKNADKNDYSRSSQVVANTGPTEACPVFVPSSTHQDIYGDMYVGIVIEGNRPIAIENVIVSTTGGGTGLTSIRFLVSMLCVISLWTLL